MKAMDDLDHTVCVSFILLFILILYRTIRTFNSYVDKLILSETLPTPLWDMTNKREKKMTTDEI